MCAGTQKSKFQPRRGRGRGRGELCCEMGHCEQLYELQLPPCSRRPGPSPAGCKRLAGLSAFWGSLCLSTTHGKGRSPLKRSIQVSTSDISKSAREGFGGCREPGLGWQMEGCWRWWVGGWCWHGAWWDGGLVGWWPETPSASPRLDDEERKGRARQHSRAPALPWGSPWLSLNEK